MFLMDAVYRSYTMNPVKEADFPVNAKD
jgi:hypothetical protein